MMNEVYGQSYFMNSLSSWSEEVTQYQGLIRAAWEGAADRAINQYVSSITTSDSYNTVAAYQDYVRLSLRSQEEAALTRWEQAANLDMLSNQANFVARLNTGRVDELYLQRVGMQDMLRLTNVEQSANTLRQDIVGAANNWQMDFDTSFQEGVDDFSRSLTDMQARYNALLTSLDESDARFQNNLTAIDRYKNAVKDGIRTILGRFDAMLAPECNQDTPCTFKEPRAGLNAAGETLKEFVRSVRVVLNDPTIDTTNVLTQISLGIRNFLLTQTTNASNQLTNYTERTDTNQMFSLEGGYLAPDGGDTTVTVADVHGSGRTIADITNQNNIKVWNLDSTHRFSGIAADLDFINLINTMVNGTTSGVEALIDLKLGSGQSSTLLAWNIYTDWNDAHNTSYLGGQRVAYLTADHLQGNYHHEVNKENTFYWIANRGFIDREQMGKIGYELLFKMHDSVAASQAIYWSGNYTALNGELTVYNRDVLPAIQNWESQVSSYNQYYTDWKAQAAQMKANAKLEYDKSVAELNEKKAKWLNAMEAQHQDAMVSWGVMYEKANQLQSAADVKLLSQQVALQVEGTDLRPGIATNTEETMDKFSGQIDAFAKTKFSSGVNGALATGNYSVLGAVDEKKMVGNLMVGNKDISEVFGKTSNGVYQFTQLISVNGNNEYTARQEQVRLANQMAYSINWDSRWAAKFDDNGNFVSSGNMGISDQMASDYLTKLKNYNASIQAAPTSLCVMGTAEYDSCSEAAKKLSEKQVKDFKEAFSNEISELAKKGLEFQNGKIVHSLTKKENDLLGIDTAKVASGGTATTKSTARAANFGTCYLNPDTTECRALLRQDFVPTFDANGVTLSRVISNGNIGGRDDKGYTSGNQTETKYIKFSQMKPVMAPTGKSLFDVWENSDWTNFENQANAVSTDFFDKGLGKTQGNLIQSTSLIRDLEAKNEAKFQSVKKAKETEDALVRDLVIAYLSGGMAGVKGAIKNKVEDTINTNIATAWARASGADESQIGLLTQALSFMKGKVQERKIKSQQATNNLSNAGTALVATATSFGNAVGQFGSALVAFKSGNFAAAGTAFVGGVQSIGQGFTAMGNAGKALFATSQSAIATGIFLGGGNTLLTGTSIGAYRAVAGDAAADQLVDRTSGQQTRLAQIKAERESMLQSNVTQAVATATGIPAEVVGNLITDYKGAKEAKGVRRAVDSNPIAGVTSRIASATLGVYKTALVAVGMPDRKIAQALSDGNKIAFSGITDRRFQQANLAITSQALGMSGPGTSYTSATPSDQKGIVKEIGQMMLVDQLAVNMSADEKAVLNAAIRGQISRNEQKAADKKAQNAAIRSTAITGVTLGVGATANGAAKSLVSTYFRGSESLFKATVNLVAQTVDGASRNGTNGAIAGFTNGAIGVLTAGGKFDLPGALRDGTGRLTQGSTLGLGVTFDREAGWGGMVGIGGAAANANVVFSQRGNTTVSGSVQDPNRPSLQFTGTSTTNGSTTIGMNYNPTGRGPRQGSNFGANYDMTTGEGSVNAGYTDPNSLIGFTTTANAHGVSTSTQYNGVNVATIDENGFTFDEMNWAEQNINNAQNRTDEIRETIAGLQREGLTDTEIRSMTHAERVAAMATFTRGHENQRLRDNGLMDSQIASLSPELRAALLTEIENNQADRDTTDAGSGAAAGTTLLSIIGAFVLGRRREGDVDSDGLPVPSESPAPDVPVEAWADPGNVTGDTTGTTPSRLPYNADSKLNQALLGKNRTEIKTYLDNLSSADINRFVKDGKNLKDNLTDTKLSVTKTDKIPVREREIDPSKDSVVRKINDKVESYVNEKLIKNYTDKLDAHSENYDNALGNYNQSSANAETIRLMGESIQRMDADSPLRKQLESTRDALIKTSESMSNGAPSSFLSSVRPTADQLIAASKKMEDYQSGKIKNLDAETSKLIAHQLVLDKDFAELAQPQALKDSYAKLQEKKSAADEGFKEALKKFENKEITQKELTTKLNSLEKEYTIALQVHKDNWKKYEGDVAKMIQNRDADRKITLSNLDKVTTNIIVDGPTKMKDVTARYKVLTDESGNYKLVASGEAALLERAEQRTQFNKIVSGLPDSLAYKVDTNTGQITTRDGKPLSMTPDPASVTIRREALMAIRESLGNDFRPDLNPNFAKLEAMGNFDVDKSSGRNFTTVNGVRFDFALTNDVRPEKSIVEADGANWMKLSQVANELNISNIGLNSVVRYDSYSHKDGYSLDVGSITVGNDVIPISHSNDDFKEGKVPSAPKHPLDRFLEQISGSESNSFSYNPYYMVDGNGNRTPNFFTATPKAEWENKKDWDGAKTGLSPSQRKEFSRLMRDMASKNEPPYILSDDNIKQMWNHRHHLHVTEVSK